LRELEAEVIKPQFKVPTTLHRALLLAAKLEEQRAALTHRVEVQIQKIDEEAPKVEAYKQLVDPTA
jgi:phage antirepressor YoqD-like protein